MFYCLYNYCYIHEDICDFIEKLTNIYLFIYSFLIFSLFFSYFFFFWGGGALGISSLILQWSLRERENRVYVRVWGGGGSTILISTSE